MVITRFSRDGSSPHDSRKHETGLFLFFLSVSLAVPLHAGDYYVSNTGNDDNSGTVSSPWASLDKARHSLAAGDRLYLHRGSEWVAQFNVPHNDITIDAYGKGDPPIIAGDPDKYFAIASQGNSGITIRNIELMNTRNDCIRIEKAPFANILIENTVIHDCNTGINIHYSDTEITKYGLPKSIAILGNRIYNTRAAAIQLRAGSGRISFNRIDRAGLAEPTNAISLHAVSDIFVEDNFITNTHSTDIDGSGITADRTPVHFGKGGIIRNNRIICPSVPANDVQAGIAIWYHPDVEVYGNIIENCNEGIRVSGNISSGYNIHDNEIISAKKRGASFTVQAPVGKLENNMLRGANTALAGIYVSPGSKHPAGNGNTLVNFKQDMSPWSNPESASGHTGNSVGQ